MLSATDYKYIRNLQDTSNKNANQEVSLILNATKQLRTLQYVTLTSY